MAKSARAYVSVEYGSCGDDVNHRQESDSNHCVYDVRLCEEMGSDCNECIQCILFILSKR